jgi:hypothetical protein
VCVPAGAGRAAHARRVRREPWLKVWVVPALRSPASRIRRAALWMRVIDFRTAAPSPPCQAMYVGDGDSTPSARSTT